MGRNGRRSWQCAALPVALGTMLLCASPVADAAQGPAPGQGGPGAQPSPATQKRAKAKFDEGVALSDEAKWTEALDAFRESNELVPMAGVQFNIAITERALGRYVDCKRTARKTLDDIASGSLKIKQPKMKIDVEGVLKECSEKIALVTIKVSPEEADVQVDGASPERLPDGRVEVDPGRHVFVATAAGYQTTTVTKEIEPGETDVVIATPPLPKARPIGKGGGPDAPQEEEATPWYESGWFWGVTGGVLAAGAAVVVIVVLVKPAEQAPAEPPAGTVDHVVPAVIRW